jgi:hypothetical protein
MVNPNLIMTIFTVPNFLLLKLLKFMSGTVSKATGSGSSNDVTM